MFCLSLGSAITYLPLASEAVLVWFLPVLHNKLILRFLTNCGNHYIFLHNIENKKKKLTFILLH